MNGIEKKIAEIKSSFNMGAPVYSSIRWVEDLCLFVSRWKYRLTTKIYFDIKYFIQRHTRGFDDLDKWNAAWFIARKAIPVLTAMRNEFHGTSIKWHREDRFGNIIELTKDEVFVDSEAPQPLSEDEWRGVLDDIIYSFKFVLDIDNETFEKGEGVFVEYSQERYDAAHKRHKRGLKLFAIYYMNLWD